MADQNNGWVDKSNSAPLNTQATVNKPDWQAYAVLIGTVWVRKNDAPTPRPHPEPMNPSLP